MAECHPVGFQWVMEAKARGATVIHVDPRFTRTSALADLHVPLRAGSDIVFLGGIINYVLAHEKYFRDYVLNYTNAATLLTEDFADTEDLDGVFSGLDREHRHYDFETWRYQGAEVSAAAGDRDRPEEPEEIHGSARREVRRAGRGEAHGSGGAAAHPNPDRDETLQHPRCVFQVLKRHFARYTPELVEQACGVPPEAFGRVCELITENSGPDRTTAFVYSVGWTQHTVGVQYIRTAAILQLLLGNIGRPGAGAGERRLGHDHHGADRDRGPRAGHRPDPPHRGAGPAPAPDRAALPLGRQRAQYRRLRERPGPPRPRPERAHPGGEGAGLRHQARAPPARARVAAARPGVRAAGGHHRRHRHGGPMSIDPAARAGHVDHPPRMGFFTDTSICIGCKACEVACKEWNAVPEDGLSLSGMSYDNTVSLGASTWRHVAFIEQPVSVAADGAGGVRWLMASDVCKHCTESACLDVCPTGALFRTEFGTVVVQDDVCNGCGYCVGACPFGVIARREEDGQAHKCTLCYDRLGAGMEPACAKACPTESIQFGPLDELRERAALRVADLRAAGQDQAQLYLDDPDDGIGGGGAFFLLLDEPEVYGLPPDPVVTTRDLPSIWKHVGLAAAGLAAAGIALGFGRRK